MVIKEIATSELKPYENNPRKNDSAVGAVAKSIEQFGFKVPLVIDKNNVIVCGHTRYKAAQKLGLEKVPCIIADDLTPAQIKAFRLADNKTAELSTWDFEKIDEELSSLINLDDSWGGIINEVGFADSPHIDFDSIPELTEENYKEPELQLLKCPKCGHTAQKSFFNKVKS